MRRLATRPRNRYIGLVEFRSYRVAHPLQAIIFPSFRNDSQHTVLTERTRNKIKRSIHQRSSRGRSRKSDGRGVYMIK